MIRGQLGAVLVLALVACAGSRGADPELLGDQSYAAGRFVDAVSHYDAALARRPGGPLWAKAGAASLHAHDFAAAARDYERLAVDDPTRGDEAADGLDRVAHAAELAGDTAALEASVLALSRVAPARPALRYALDAARGRELPPAGALTILPAALAAADDPRLVDSLLLRYGVVLERTAACEEAQLAYRAVVRRSADSVLRGQAVGGYNRCALRLGLGSMTAGRPADGQRWFGRILDTDSSSWTGRRALIGLGDARREQGDTSGAMQAYQTAAAAGGAADSLSQLAAGRLNALAQSRSAGDSTRKSTP